MVVPPVDHDCSLVGLVTELLGQLEKHTHEIEQLKKALYGKRSERSKLPPVKTAPPATREQIHASRTCAATSSRR